MCADSFKYDILSDLFFRIYEGKGKMSFTGGIMSLMPQGICIFSLILDHAMKQLPNILSISRILITPVFLWLLLIPTYESRLMALVLFIIAGATDWLDGRLARAYKVKSRFGQFIDPLADKIFVLGTFLFLPLIVPQIPWWVVLLVALRDLSITLLRSWAEKRNKPIPTLYSAKIKTTVQFAFLFWVLVWLVLTYRHDLSFQAAEYLHGSPTYWFMMVMLGLTLITGLQYFWKMRQDEY